MPTTQQILSLDDAWPHIDSHLERMAREQADAVKVIVVAGGSATGKSTHISQPIAKRLGDQAILLSQDMFQRIEDLDKLDPVMRWDAPENYGIDACAETIARARAGESFTWPQYNFMTRSHVEHRAYEPRPWLIIEGMYAAWETLLPHADLSIYAEAPRVMRMVRRVFRNRYERYPGKAVAAQTVAGFNRSVCAAHALANKKQRDHVDLIIRTDAPFARFVERFQIPTIDVHPMPPLWSADYDSATQVTLEKEPGTPDEQGPELRIWHGGACYLSETLDPETAELIQQADPQEL